ncbi:unnamed protein product [Adineta ricciae]|uniref:Magnesium transporter n=1 Tax=Adineta ricciae TaxID=249248 RepID=A0A815B503_ADIRI|nr:unnamed protein product [Adineta ricciae]CAF1265440.1 unnamed protein product [Adineta ricciae]
MRLFLSLLCKRYTQRTLFQTASQKISIAHNCFRYQSSDVVLSQLDKIPHITHKLNCDIYILTKDGKLNTYQGPFDRAKICQEYGLEPRDLQKIDTDLLINVPIIDIRQNRFIIFSFRRLRSLIELDRSIFFVPAAEKIAREPLGFQDDIHWERIAQAYQRIVLYIHKTYQERFINQTLINVDSIPFEFRLTEINLESVAHGLRLKGQELLIQFQNVRERAYSRITIGSLRELALLKEKVDKYKRNADLAHQAIVDVLAQDEDMIGMYLTDTRKRDISDHIQVELLLEACTKQMAEVRRTISDLSDSVRTLESATGFMLDAVRNELLSFEIRINIITMSLGMGAFIAGTFGMNLTNGIEQNPYAFYAITGTSIVLIGGAIVRAFARLSRYRRIRLHRSNKIDTF